MRMMLRATDGLPVNVGFTGKGNDSGGKGMEDIVRAGAAGLKLHEDWGSTPEAIRHCLDVADRFEVQVNLSRFRMEERTFKSNHRWLSIRIP